MDEIHIAVYSSVGFKHPILHHKQLHITSSHFRIVSRVTKNRKGQVVMELFLIFQLTVKFSGLLSKHLGY